MTNKTQIKVSYIIVFIIIISSVIYHFVSFEEKVLGCGTPDYIDYAGNYLNESEIEGRKLFKTLCASCHKLDKKLIGPALANENLKFDYFFEFTINEENLLNSANLQAKKINNDYKEFTYNHSFTQLSQENIKTIYNYVNMAYLN